MIFWIITTLAVVGSVSISAYLLWEDEWFGLVQGFFISLGIALAWLLAVGLLVFVSGMMSYNHEESESVSLRALGSDSSVSGSFFLGSGYVNGERVLSYIKENKNGSFTTGQVEGKHAEIWELEDAKPQMVTHTQYSDRWWLIPERVKTGTWWEFRVPEGSVSESFEVKP